jgi:hypothetical protein
MVFYDIMVVLDNNHGYILPEGAENCKSWHDAVAYPSLRVGKGEQKGKLKSFQVTAIDTVQVL